MQQFDNPAEICHQQLQTVAIKTLLKNDQKPINQDE
jgi:hypothetical protein